MTRLEHFHRLCDLDGLVCARTLARECGITERRAGEWLMVQALRDRIRRVVPGRFAAFIGPARREAEPRRQARLRAQARERARLVAAGACTDCHEPTGGEHWRCEACRAVRAAKKRERKQEAA